VDSLTQIVLGAVVGEIVLGKKVGNKAPLWGAIAGTIPDLDVFVGMLFDTVSRMEMHRGFSHSILFSVLFAPVFGYVVHYLFYKKGSVGPKEWTKLFFWGLFTHPLLDAHTTWGTQLLWPLKYKVAYHNIFVVDPLYTLPFLGCLLVLLFIKRQNPLRQKLAWYGIGISSFYMLITIGFKFYTLTKFQSSLAESKIEYSDISTRPTPLNSILWNANIMSKDSIYIGNYSMLDDSDKINFYGIPKNHNNLGALIKEEKVQRLIALTQGWYTITKDTSGIYLNDLRFGQMGMYPEAPFVFSFKLEQTKKGLIAIENRKEPKEAIKQLNILWERIKGNNG